jgi:hydroxymethylglutaryl-CoA lyase
MGFGNPYGDAYTSDIAIEWVEKLQQLGIQIFSMSDTVGVSNADNIQTIFSDLVKRFPTIEFGAHFHSTKETAVDKIEAAFQNNCFRFDSAMNGIGGCPMAQNELVGNIATEQLLAYFESKGIDFHLNQTALEEAMQMAGEVFSV